LPDSLLSTSAALLYANAGVPGQNAEITITFELVNTLPSSGSIFILFESGKFFNIFYH